MVVSPLSPRVCGSQGIRSVADHKSSESTGILPGTSDWHLPGGSGEITRRFFKALAVSSTLARALTNRKKKDTVARADRAEAGREDERARADALRDRLAAAEAAAEQARTQGEAAHDRAEAAEHGGPPA
jgi:hypothetical protein